MRNLSKKEKQLVAEFFSNVGVAWFAAGVIGGFVNKIQTFFDLLSSLFWGLALSAIFVYFGVRIIRGDI